MSTFVHSQEFVDMKKMATMQRELDAVKRELAAAKSELERLRRPASDRSL